MPPLPNSNTSPYPSYPRQSNASMPMPGYPAQSMPQAPFGAGFVPPPSTAYPSVPPSAYPSQPMHNAYPSMPPQHAPPSAYPSAYPPSSTTVYPPSNPNAPHIPHSNVLPPQQQGYSGYGYQQSAGPSYPNVSNMAACFSQMQGHIKDVRRSKVCFILSQHHIHTTSSS